MDFFAHKDQRSWNPGRLRARSAGAAVLLASTLTVVAFPLPASATTTCATTTGTDWTAEVCLTADSVATGSRPVAATVTSTGSAPSKVEFSLGSTHLITDYSPSYAFTLHSQDFQDAATTISVAATLRDGTVTAAAQQSISLDNGNTTVPVNPNTFTPPSAAAPTATDPLVLAVTGDGAGGEPSATAVTDMMASWNPELVNYVGDVYQDGTLTEFKNWYGTGSSWFSRFRSITAPTIGNHEYDRAVAGGPQSADGYFAYWDNVPHRYSYDIGDWHFVSLDSTSQFDETDTLSAQYEWLASDLAANANRCTIVSFHHPYKNIGPEMPATRMAAIWSLMRQHNVTLVMNGHDHNYQRWTALDSAGTAADPRGVTELVVGGGGHGLQNFVASDPLVAASAVSFGAARIELRPDRADISYRTPDGSTGKEQDSAIIPCQGLSPDTTAPSAPTGVSAVPDSTPSAAWAATVSWSAATDNRSVAQYRIHRDGLQVGSVPASALTWQDVGLTYSTTYAYTVSAVDAAGNESVPSAVAPVTTGPPSASATGTFTPTGDAYVSQANPGSRYGTATVLRASNSATAGMVSYLKFDVGGTYANITNVTLRLRATANATTGMTVHRAGTAWNDGSKTAPQWSSAPTVGTQIAVVPPYSNGTWVEVDITNSATVTGDGVYGFALKSLSGTQINWNSRESGGATAPQLVVTSSPPPDTAPPTVPQQVTATSTEETMAGLTWAASIDDVGVGSYRIYRNGQLLDTVAGTTTAYSDVTVHAGEVFSYAVSAVDAAGNASAQSASASVTPPDITAPIVETFAAVLDNATTARLVWSGVTDNVAPTGFRVRRDGVLIATLPATATSYVQPGLAALTTYSYSVSAFDAAGNASDALAAAVTTPTSGTGSAPTVPTGLSIGVTGETSLSLSWVASTDDVAVAAYEVYRGGVSVAVVPGTSTSWTDTGLTAATTYSYTVRAGDADGNWSAQTAAVAGTTLAPDTTPPSVPTALNGTGASTTSISVNWAASTDDRAVAGYGVYRDDVLVGSVDASTTAYLDEGLVLGSTHTYAVDAVDAAGNRSARTAGVSVRTLVPGDMTETSTATADAYVNSANPNSKYGTATALRVNGTAASEMHTYLRFNPSGTLPVVRSATLTLGATSKVNALLVRTVSGAWSESTLTWALRPTAYGSVNATSPGIPAAGTFTIDVTSLVTSGAPVELVITTTATTQAAFSSREAASPAVVPSLSVTSGY